MVRPLLRLAFLAAFALATVACEENLDPATPDGALHRLRDTVVNKDAAAVLQLASARTQTLLEEFLTVAQAHTKAIEEQYPVEHRAAARAQYPPGLLGAATTAGLFEALVKPELTKLAASPGERYGMTAQGSPSIDGEHATVTSQASESYEFVFEGGAWKATVFERTLQQNLNRLKLMEQTLDENLKVAAELHRREEARRAKEAAAASDGGVEPAPAPASAPAPAPAATSAPAAPASAAPQ